MAEYCQFLGRRVTVRYRLGAVLLSASGIFSADSGRSIFLEQSLEQRGTRKHFRWEIPYPYIYRIQTEATIDAGADARPNEQNSTAAAFEKQEPGAETSRQVAAAAGKSSSSASSFASFLNPRTTEETA
jgi:hypothetical protein